MTIMNTLDLEKEFYSMETILSSMKSRIDEISAQTLIARGPYIEFPIFSYQRSRMQQGRLIKNINRIKSYKDIYRYTFDSTGKLILEERGNRLGQFWNIFYLYDKNEYLYLSYAYDDLGEPANVTSYKFMSEKLQSSKSHGFYGIRSEEYFYDGDILRKIVISAREHDEENSENAAEYFHYDAAGALSQIELEYKVGSSEIIYKHQK